MADAFGSLGPVGDNQGEAAPYDMSAVIQEILRNRGFSFPAPAAAPAVSAPNLNIQSGQFLSPRIEADYSVPMLGGSMGLLGSYERNPENPALSEWSARMQYKRRF